MTDKEYEQKKAACRRAFYEDQSLTPHSVRQALDYAFDRAYALGKQDKDADTVISGWVAKDADVQWVYLYSSMPTRGINMWNGHGSLLMPLDANSFPDLTWDDDPIEVEIILKRKKK